MRLCVFLFCLCARALFVICCVTLYGFVFFAWFVVFVCACVCLCLRVLFVISCVLSNVFVLFCFVCVCVRCLIRLCVVFVICLCDVVWFDLFVCFVCLCACVFNMCLCVSFVI